MMGNNYFFKKLTPKHTEEKERFACNYTIAQETKNSNLYNRNYAQNVKTRTSNNIFNMKKVDLDES